MPEALDVDREIVKALFIQGFTATQVARKTNLNPSTVSTWAHRGKWVSLRAKTDAALTNGTNGHGTEQGRVIKAEVSAESARCRQMLSDQLLQVLLALAGISIEKTKDKLRERCDLLASIVGSAKVVHGWDNESTPGLAGLSELRMLREALAPRPPAGEVVDVQEVKPVLAPDVSIPPT